MDDIPAEAIVFKVRVNRAVCTCDPAAVQSVG